MCRHSNMVWAFLFAACALLCLELGESVHCNDCPLKDQTGCLIRNQGCHADAGEKCMTAKIMYEGTEKFRVLGCSKFGKRGCGLVKESNGHTLKITCCSRNNCNK